jgi:demethylspheroidene O-methyltransferase
MIPTPWRDGWIAWRNRLIANPAFQRWATDFPLTKPIADRRARRLFDLVAGFVYSQTLAACVRLRLFDLLRDGPKTVGTLAESLRLPLDTTQTLLGAGAALGLVDRVGPGRYGLGAQGAALIGNAGLIEMIEHHEHLYADLADSVALLRRCGRPGDLAAYWPYATSNAPRATGLAGVSAYSALMSATQPTVAADLLHAYPLRRHRRLMDVGGGEGAFLAAVAAQNPNLNLMLFDLPAVATRARAKLLADGLRSRVEILEGDFLTDPLPPGADLITLIRILHDHDDAGVATILRAARAALPTDGALLIAEPMSGAPTADPVCDVYFAFYLLAMGRGRARTPAELIDLLREAGFGRARQLRTRSPFLLRAIVAQP